MEVLEKAIAFIAIIVTGYILKRKKIFDMSSFTIISNLIVRLTLPAAIIANFSKLTVDMNLMIVMALGILANLIMCMVGYIINIKKSNEDKAFSIINLPGYNIGTFTMPFVQSFLGPMGVATTSFFDTGNALFCLNGNYVFANMALKKSSKIKFLHLLKTMFSSIPFNTYIIMTIFAMTQIRLPKLVITYANTVGNANPFLALLLLGIGIEIRLKKEDVNKIVKIITTRYLISAILAFLIFNYTPFALEVRQALLIIMFAPVSSMGPIFTEKLKLNTQLSSTINSLSIIISVIVISIILIVQG